MLKVEFHTHTSDDPADRIPHTTLELIDRAAELRYDAVAITLHDRQLDLGRLTSYASERGIVLIRGIERTIQGRHVLLLNYSRKAEDVRSFDDLRVLRQRERGLVVAPHPFFPAPNCLRGWMHEHPDVFDAVEWNAMFTRVVNFNLAAARWAARHGKPLVGNGDIHILRQLGSTYSRVDAERHPAAICEAVLAGKVEVVSRPLSSWEAGSIVGTVMFGTVFGPRGASEEPAGPGRHGLAIMGVSGTVPGAHSEARHSP